MEPHKSSTPELGHASLSPAESEEAAYLRARFKTLSVHCLLSETNVTRETSRGLFLIPSKTAAFLVPRLQEALKGRSEPSLQLALIKVNFWAEHAAHSPASSDSM